MQAQLFKADQQRERETTNELMETVSGADSHASPDRHILHAHERIHQKHILGKQDRLPIGALMMMRMQAEKKW